MCLSIGALFLSLRVLVFTMHLSVDVSGYQSLGLHLYMWALFSGVSFVIHRTSSCGYVWWSIKRLACLYRGCCVFVFVLGYTMHLAVGVFGLQFGGLHVYIVSFVFLCLFLYSLCIYLRMFLAIN